MRRNSEFLYQKLYGIIKEQIIAGFIRPGDYLLPESELCRLHGMSRNSVRKALDELQKEGLVIKRAGLGTMVPEDLSIDHSSEPILRILAPFPAYFVDYGLQWVIDAFVKEHPGVSVKILHLPAGRFRESLQLSREIGVKSDLVLLSDQHLRDMEDMHYFADLSEPLGESLDAIYPKVLQRYRREGETLAIPITFTPTFLVCNPNLFHANQVSLPSIDWGREQFVDACQRLTETQGEVVTRYGFSITPGFSRWPVFALQSREPHDTETISEHSLRGGLDLLQTILFRHRTAVMYHRMNANPFLYEKSAMTLATTFELSSWVEADIPFVPQIAPLPFGRKKSTLLQSNALMVPKSCNNPTLAHDFIRTALRQDIQHDLAEHTPFLSVNSQINEHVKGVPLLQAMNVDISMMDDNHFLYDLFPDVEYDVELDLFWMGLSSISSTVDALLRNR